MPNHPNKLHKMQRGFTLSRADVRKINAIEGIDLDGQISRELEEFDKLNLTADQRREAIRAKFAKALV